MLFKLTLLSAVPRLPDFSDYKTFLLKYTFIFFSVGKIFYLDILKVVRRPTWIDPATHSLGTTAVYTWKTCNLYFCTGLVSCQCPKQGRYTTDLRPARPESWCRFVVKMKVLSPSWSFFTETKILSACKVIQRFESSEEFNCWLPVANTLGEGLQKLLSPYDKCVNEVMGVKLIRIAV